MDAKIRPCIIGGLLVTRTMITHDSGAGLNVPIRIAIFQAKTGEVMRGRRRPARSNCIFS